MSDKERYDKFSDEVSAFVDSYINKVRFKPEPIVSEEIKIKHFTPKVRYGKINYKYKGKIHARKFVLSMEE
jgi:hypothetical protein